MYISPKASGGNARLVSSILGIGTTNDLVKYLGIPLVHKKVGGALYRELIDKVKTRLSGWKSKVTSLILFVRVVVRMFASGWIIGLRSRWLIHWKPYLLL